MTPGMQIRLWLRTAARSQVAATFAVLAAVVALLVASVSQGSPAGKAESLATDGALPVATSTAGTTGALPGAPVSAPGRTAVAGAPGGGSSLAGGSTGTTGAGGSGATSGGSFGTTGGGTGAQAFDLTRATDRGVNNCAGVKTYNTHPNHGARAPPRHSRGVACSREGRGRSCRPAALSLCRRPERASPAGSDDEHHQRRCACR